MGYLEKNVVSSKETIKIVPKKNPIFLVLKWIWGVLGCWLLLIPTFRAISATVAYVTTEYLITDQKVLEKSGWISTHTDEMPLAKVENIVVNYTFWGKIFNYGTVVLQGANHNNITFTDIKDAESLKKQINELL
ncbi:MAG: PH domain-containing protein [Clostridia bacterium]|nr:PH domain-containing protein [Clostridia bacterium]